MEKGRNKARVLHTALPIPITKGKHGIYENILCPIATQAFFIILCFILYGIGSSR